jgi:hypothetical protein
MTEKEMSGKDLLDQLYRGLDVVPAVEAEMDAQQLRELAPSQAAEPQPAQTELAAKAAPEAPASRANFVRSPLMILCGIAVAGTIAAAAVLTQSETQTPPSAPLVIAPPSPPPEQVASVAAPEVIHYVELVNPFDATEVFKFPPGTSKSDARDQMAALLLERAIERKAHLSRTRKLAAEQPHATNSGRGS